MGILYVAPPMAHTRGGLCGGLKRAEIPYTQPYPDILAVDLNTSSLETLAAALTSALTPAELRECRSLILSPGRAPSVQDLMRMQPLSALLASVEGRWLSDLLREKRLTTFFQPIVDARAPDSYYGYECLLRGLDRDGALIPPNRIFETARLTDLLSSLDQAARLSAIRGAVEHGIHSCLFINFNPTAIYDPVFCLRATIQAIREAEIPSENVVFEVVESDEVREVGHLLRILDYYREHGFRVALDDLGAGYSGLNLLSQIRPDFIKLDMELVRNVHADPYKAAVAQKVLEMAHSLGVLTIAEGIESHHEYEWCRDGGADYLQGYYFAKPGCPPQVPTLWGL